MSDYIHRNQSKVPSLKSLAAAYKLSAISSQLFAKATEGSV